jgi:hypothetical protein
LHNKKEGLGGFNLHIPCVLCHNFSDATTFVASCHVSNVIPE